MPIRHPPVQPRLLPACSNPWLHQAHWCEIENRKLRLAFTDRRSGAAHLRVSQCLTIQSHAVQSVIVLLSGLIPRMLHSPWSLPRFEQTFMLTNPHAVLQKAQAGSSHKRRSSSLFITEFIWLTGDQMRPLNDHPRFFNRSNEGCPNGEVLPSSTCSIFVATLFNHLLNRWLNVLRFDLWKRR